MIDIAIGIMLVIIVIFGVYIGINHHYLTTKVNDYAWYKEKKKRSKKRK